MPFLGELSGAYSIVGQSALAGMQTAVFEINKNGGVNGHPLQIKTYDGQSDPTLQAAAVRQLLATHPSFMTMAVASANFEPSLSSVIAAKVSMVSATVPAPDYSKASFHTTNVSLDGQAEGPFRILTSVLGKSLTGKKIAIEELQSPAAQSQADYWKQQITADGGTVGETIIDPSISVASWSSQASKIVASHADAILIDNGVASDTTIAKALKSAGFTGPMVTDANSNSDTLLQAVDAKNLYVTRDAVAVEPGGALFKAVQAAGVNTTNAEGNFFSKGYADAYIVADVLKKCGITCSGADFGPALQQVGKIDLPDPAFYGTLDYSSGSESGVHFAQGWTWDTSTNTAKSQTPILTLQH